MTINCIACLKNEPVLIKIWETDSSNVKWVCKLLTCVPEVEWKEEDFICQLCISQLDIACNFRSLCIQSDTFRKEQLKNCTLKGVKHEHVESAEQETTEHFFNTVVGSDNENETRNKNIVTEKGFMCNYCEKCFLYKSSLYGHIKTHIKSRNFIAVNHAKLSVNKDFIQKCDIKYEDNEYDEIIIAEQTKTDGNSIKQDKLTSSDSVCDTKEKVKRGRPKSEPIFSCNSCGFVFKSNKKLQVHAVKEHGAECIKPYGCDECDSKFSTASNLLQHKKYHTGQRTNICSYCGKGYITKSDLNIHEKQHLNKREYKCEECPKSFNTYKDLRSHKLVVHTDPRQWNYVCTFCEKRFPIKSNLDQHTRRHMGDKRFGCHICEKRFVDKVVLQKHVKSHSNVRAYKCDQCNKEYKDKKILDIHLTKIHGIGNAKIPVRVKKYFCHMCPKSYFAKNKLTRHLCTHTGERPFVCHMCDKKFTDKSYVKQHLRSTHNVFEYNENK